MSNDASKYLEQYERHRAEGDGNRRFLGLASFLRGRLDKQAARLGQVGRHALFLPRALELCGIADDGARTVMEFGAGDGWAMHYRRPGLRRIAVDASSNFAPRLAELGIEFVEHDLSAGGLPGTDGSVDLIIVNHLIEHLSDPRIMLAECHRLLRPGGALYLRTPNIARVGWRFYDDYTHVKPFTPTGLRELCAAHGFAAVFCFASDHSRINLDILSRGRLRRLLFGRLLGGAEIEAAFTK